MSESTAEDSTDGTSTVELWRVHLDLAERRLARRLNHEGLLRRSEWLSRWRGGKGRVCRSVDREVVAQQVSGGRGSVEEARNERLRRRGVGDGHD